MKKILLIVTAIMLCSSAFCADIDSLKKAAEQGDVRAQFNLGLVYSFGDGVPQDYKESVRWYRKAAEQGDANAQVHLGSAYSNGRGVLQDYKESVKWYRKAAEQGDAYAHLHLGVIYSYGQGVPQDYAEAYFWANISAIENPSSASLRDEIAAKLTLSKTEEVQARCKKWLEDFEKRKALKRP